MELIYQGLEIIAPKLGENIEEQSKEVINNLNVLSLYHETYEKIMDEVVGKGLGPFAIADFFVKSKSKLIELNYDVSKSVRDLYTSMMCEWAINGKTLEIKDFTLLSEADTEAHDYFLKSMDAKMGLLELQHYSKTNTISH